MPYERRNGVLMQKDNNDKFNIPYATRREAVLYAALACLNMALLAVLCYFTSVNPAVLAVAVVAAYLAEVAYVALKRTETAEISHELGIHALLAEEGSVVFKNSTSPIVVFDSFGTIRWYNRAMSEALASQESFIGKNISAIMELDESFVDDREKTVTVNDAVYSVEGFRLSGGESDLYMAVLRDITRLSLTEKKYLDERVAVAYIAIDNVEDVFQYVHEKFADEVSKVDDRLKEWAASMNAIIKSYENEKYVMLLDSKCLDACVADRFSILDKIRDSRVGDGTSITVSIGVSKKKGSLAERELDAKDAVDMALQRGGDQVVYKSDDEVVYYGGRTKSVYKRSNVRSRTVASQLTALMARSDNVIIMGHRYGDFDSFGAAIGIARLASLCGSKVNIAVDPRDRNLAPCIEMMQATELYSQVFVDNAEGLDLIGPDTLVVLVDHSSFARAQFSDIAMKAASVAIVDHHRRIDAAAATVKLSYIEPSASSASELVSEMLESAVSSQSLLKEEADLLLAGILLDTKQFTRNTGTRTFGAAQYLRGAGANPTDVYNLFKTLPEDLSKEARFHTSITVYRGNIAISSCDGENDESYRIVASKAADKMLSLRGVEAAFALVKIGDQIHISGRSSGKINVQLILEGVGGGGHFDVAGAQVISDSITEILELLKSSIDSYLAQ